MARQKSAWDQLSMNERAQFIRLGLQHGLSNLKDIRDTYNLYRGGGDLGAYNTFVETLPDNMKHTDTAKYDMYRYWELNGRPKDFEEAKKKEMFHKESDGYYHANTLAEVTNSPDKHYGTLEFIKAKNHNTIGLEVGAYLKDKNHPMRNKEYILDYTGDKARYRPRTYAESILPEGAYVGNIPITAQYVNGGNLAHKKSGEAQGENQELNTKTYKEKKENSTYPMLYNILSQSLGDTSLSGAILRALMYKNAEDPNIYTGSYYFGDKWGFGTSQELPQNRNLISLYLDGDTTGFKQFNGKPIVLDGDTLTQTQYEGTLLPQDTIYLRPESKATIARMTKDRDLLKINNSFPGWMSYSSKYNFLDSPYFLDKYEGKVIDDANNSNISFKQNSDGSYYADVFDLWDLTGTGGYKAGARLEKKLATDSIENNGPFILRQHIPIVFNKDSVSDGRFLDAISAGQWQEEIDATNQKSTGGPLYPFSFEKNPFLKTPIVRY